MLALHFSKFSQFHILEKIPIEIHKEGNIGNDASDDDEEELSSEYDSNEDDIMNENKENDTKYYFCNECDYKCSRSVLYLDKHMKTVNNNHQEPTVEDSSISKSGNKKNLVRIVITTRLSK